MDPRAPVSPSTAPERMISDSRTPLSPATLEATATLLTLGSEAPAPPLELDASGPALVALSEDHRLLQTLTLAVIERMAVVTCPSADRFVDQLVANGAEIAVIDAAIAPNPLDIFLLALHRQFPQLQLVVVGPPALQSELAAQIADSTIFRFAHKPASPESLQLMLFAALREAEGTSPRPQGSGYRPEWQAGSVGRGGRRWVWPLLLAMTAAAAAVIGWLASAYAGRHLAP